MKKRVSILLAAVIAMNLVACSQSGNVGSGSASATAATQDTIAETTTEGTGESPSAITYTPGTYEGSGTGMNGDIVVEVTVTEDTIVSMIVKEHQETPGHSDPALEQIPEAVVRYQSLGVDSVSGATMTSNGLLAAAANALEQSGADVSALQAVSINRDTATAENMTTQVVVAGSGMSGMMAAVTAADEGADVILVEKLGVLGGSAGTAAGGLATAESELIPAEMDDSVERAIAYTRLMNETSVMQPNYEFLATILGQTGETVEYIAEEFGIMPEFEDRGDFVRTRYTSGRDLIDGLAVHLEGNGATVLMNTSAKEIVMEGEEAVGLKVSGPDGEFIIYADKVIIATGSANWDTERMLAENPELSTVTMQILASAGNTGDGFRMLEEIGAGMGEGPRVKDAIVSFTSLRGMGYFANQMIFDADGNRFCNESPLFMTMLNTFLQRQESPAYYALYSAGQVDADMLAALEADAVGDDPKKTVYGETIEELAEKLQIPAATLRASFDRYQDFCADGTDADYGKEASHLIAYEEEGGFYAASLQASTWGTYGGAMTDEQFRVLNEEGNVINNVFAVGECANSEFYGDYYYGAFSLGLYSTAGRIAGETAVSEINSGVVAN